MTKPLTGRRLSLRELRAFRGGLLLLGIVIVLASAAITAWPRITSALLTTALRHDVSSASAPLRDLQSSMSGITKPFIDRGDYVTQSMEPTWAAMPDALLASRDDMPAAVRAVTSPARFLGRADGPTASGVPASGTVDAPPASVFTLSFEGNPALTTDAVLDTGAWPRPTSALPSERPLEVAMSSAAAKTMHWSVGQTQTISIDRRAPQIVLLTGTVHPRDAGSDYWQLDTGRNRAGVKVSVDGNVTTYHGVAWVDASTWPSIALSFGGSTIRSWYPVDGERFDLDHLDAITSGLQKYLSSPRQFGDSQPPQTLRLGSSLTGVIDGFTSTAGPANTLMAIFATGPLGTALAVLVLGVRLLVARRQAALSLQRARGASALRVRGGLALQTAAASVPGALLGGVLGTVLTAGAPQAATVWSLAACGILPPLVAALGGGSTPGVGRRSRWRWIAEVVVIAVATLSVVVLFQHGLGAGTGAFTPDPLLTLTPVLVAAAVCVIVLRLYPVLMRWVGALLRRGRGVVGYVGWANSMRAPAGGLWPMFAVIIGVSITVFSLAILTTERAATRSAADPLPAGPLLPGMEGIAATAVAISALMCVAVLALTLVMNSAERLRLHARLHALGFGRGQATGLIAWELGPTATIGIVAGGLVGLLLPVILLASIDLGGITGGDDRPPLVIDPVLTVAAAIGFAVAATIATAAAIGLAGREPAASILRSRGEE